MDEVPNTVDEPLIVVNLVLSEVNVVVVQATYQLLADTLHKVGGDVPFRIQVGPSGTLGHLEYLDEVWEHDDSGLLCPSFGVYEDGVLLAIAATSNAPPLFLITKQSPPTKVSGLF